MQSAIEGAFTLVVSQFALTELFRNLDRKKQGEAKQFADLLATLEVEVVSEGDKAHIEAWRTAGLKTDAAIVAAAVEAEVDFLCTGDGGIHEMRHAVEAAGVKVISPRDLLELISDSEHQ